MNAQERVGIADSCKKALVGVRRVFQYLQNSPKDHISCSKLRVIFVIFKVTINIIYGEGYPTVVWTLQTVLSLKSLSTLLPHRHFLGFVRPFYTSSSSIRECYALERRGRGLCHGQCLT